MKTKLHFLNNWSGSGEMKMQLPTEQGRMQIRTFRSSDLTLQLEFKKKKTNKKSNVWLLGKRKYGSQIYSKQINKKKKFSCCGKTFNFLLKKKKKQPPKGLYSCLSEIGNIIINSNVLLGFHMMLFNIEK